MAVYMDARNQWNMVLVGWGKLVAGQTVLNNSLRTLQAHSGKRGGGLFSKPQCPNVAATHDKGAYKQLGQEGIKYLLEEFVSLPIDQMQVMHHFQHDQLNILGVAQFTIETWQHALSLLPIQIVAFLP